MKHIYCLILAIFTLFKVNAQDIHFAHIHASPLLLNPSMAGLFEGDVRVIANLRNQWKEATADYTTVAASVDGRLARIGSAYIGTSLMAFNDRAGDLNFSQTEVSFSTSLGISLSRYTTHYVALGVETGLLTYNIDYSNIHMFDNEPYAGPASAYNSTATLDLSVGLTWWYRINKNYMLYAGSSYKHVNDPNVAIIGKAYGTAETLMRRFTVHGGGDVAFKPGFAFLPSFLYMQQGPHRECLLGGFVRYAGKNASVFYDYWYLGGWVRYSRDRQFNINNQDAAVVTLRMDKDLFTLAFSYDINFSSLTPASNYRGGPELSVIYTFDQLGGSIRTGSCPANERVKRPTLDCPKF